MLGRHLNGRHLNVKYNCNTDTVVATVIDTVISKHPLYFIYFSEESSSIQTVESRKRGFILSLIALP